MIRLINTDKDPARGDIRQTKWTGKRREAHGQRNMRKRTSKHREVNGQIDT